MTKYWSNERVQLCMHFFGTLFHDFMGGNDKIKVKGKGGNKDFKETVSTKTKNMDFGLGLGLTYNITENVFVQGRYTMGMTNVFDYKEGDGFGTPAKPKNGNAQVSIGFRF